jgi:prepilin-type N-terminal cleavage/methylation domain-containing protein
MLRLRSDILPGLGLSASRPAGRRGFTLIEVMVVIAILVILAALLVAVASGVIGTSKGRQTHATLHVLDGVMQTYLKDGNPEPDDPNLSGYSANTDMQKTNPVSDATRWVKALRADPDGAKGLSQLKSANVPDPDVPNAIATVIVDAWGTPIRYVPYDKDTKKSGYFESAGPDGQFLTTTDPPPAPAKLPPDDLYSTDPM